MKLVTFNAPHAVAWALGGLILVQLFAFERSWQTLRSQGGAAAGPRLTQPHMSHALVAKAIVDGHLFGAAPSPKDDRANARVSTTYNLKGVIALGAAGQGFAILGTSDGKSKLYQTGDSRSAQVVLQEVGRDYVLLLNDSKLERLTLPRGQLATLLASAARHDTGAAAQATALTDDTRATLKAFGLNVIEDGAGGISGISGTGSPGWRQSGLLASDVIVAIDGTPVSQVLKTPMAIDNASVSAVTVLTVLRDGAEVEIDASQQAASVSPSLRLRRGT